ncbi:TonB-dependent receptor family protein [Horticoccus sp. 23ND18S-11]|uniref:TonB-dependent receptor family protein n=1 Tax=Horticoccus sp. 23ND18S-11 TaxID=3391832 RepID=UPI0039C99514
MPFPRSLFPALAIALAVTLSLRAAPATEPPVAPPPVQLPAFQVEAEAEKDHFIQGPFLPDVQGTKVNVGKKTTILDFDRLPRINGNNYRQALSDAPGLILSEETSPLVSIGYRGLQPHRAQFTQVMKDGIPIHADPFGYPEAYYTPPLDTVDRIEFMRGGAALVYGPQPGGALNYVTHRPRTDVGLGGSTLHTFGSDGYYSSFSYLDGTTGPLGYYGYYNHRESDGIRSANSDYRLDAFTGRLTWAQTTASRVILTLETYAEEHGEPGGLTFATGPGTINYGTQRETPSRLFDRFTLDRQAASLVWERDFARGTFVGRLWAIDYTRASRRQGGGGFGTLPTGAAAQTNTIERQQFNQLGAEARARLDWGQAERHVFTAGALYLHGNSPRTDSRGATPDADNGELRIKTQRATRYLPIFAENLFRFGDFSVTPGLRLELIEQRVRERFNAARVTTPLQQRTARATVPLAGFGAAYDLGRGRDQLYFNVSQSYRPIVFTDAVPNAATTIVNADLAESHALQFEAGYRGEPAPGLVLDASVFHLAFDDQIGSTTLPGGLTSVANLGRAVHRGAELSVRYDLLARRAGSTRDPDRATLNVFANTLILDAAFTAGANRDRTPQYAPRHVVRTGLAYTRGAGLKLALTGTLSADSFADDNNTAQRYVPSYAVWDLTAEWRVPGFPIRLVGGVNNVLDEDYYNRIRPDGIDPAPGRKVYLGVAFEF